MTPPTFLNPPAPTPLLAHTSHAIAVQSLACEPTEAFRTGFEDGDGTRADAEEDACAAQCANEVATGMTKGSLPPFIGIRAKTFSHEMHARGIRTLDVF